MNTAPYRFCKPKRPVTKVFIHCSASDNPAHDNVATMDAWHRANGWAGTGYHFFLRKAGLLELGRDLEKTPAAQAPYNTGTIAICLHGLARDKFTEAQFIALVGLCQQINVAYGGNVTFHGHCEVAAKACPVFAYRDVLGLDKAGHLVIDRSIASNASLQTPWIDGTSAIELPDTGKIAGGTLKLGDKGGGVESLQKNLTALGYHVGMIDGDFGRRTRDAVMAFQADHHLVPDGKFGPASREAMMSAPKPRPVSKLRAAATVGALAAEGSTVAKASIDMGVAGGLLSVGGAIAALNQASGILSGLAEHTGAVGQIISGLVPWQGGALAALGAFIMLRAVAAGRSHTADFRSGKNA